MGPPYGPGGPGQGQQPQSTVTVGRTNEVVTIKFDLHWKEPVYQNRVAGPLKDYFDGVAGQGMLLAGKYPWRRLPETLKRFEGTAGRKLPQAALSRTATASRMGLPFAPEQRLSWMVELLPSLGYENLYNQIDRGQGWNAPDNLRAGRAWIPEFLDPTQMSSSWRAELASLGGKDLGGTHFVGLSGIGQDAAELDDTPDNAKRLGVFGYNRQTSLDAIQAGDGLGNTIYMIQTQPNIARPWIRGGGATVQGVPYKNSFETFRVMQSDARFGAQTIMADGSVRTIRPGVADDVFQALVTYKGGEKVEGLDELAPIMEFPDKSGKRSIRTGPKAGPRIDVLPASPPLPNWQTQSVQTLRATFAFNMPRGRLDMMANLPERKTLTCDAPSTRLTYGFDALYKPGLLRVDPDGSGADKEVQVFLAVNGLILDGPITDAPPLSGSKGKQFKAKPNNEFKGTHLFRLWVCHENRAVASVFSEGEVKPADAEEYFKTIAGFPQGGGSFRGIGRTWEWIWSPPLKIAFQFPGDPQVFAGGDDDPVFFFWPKDGPAEGGAKFLIEQRPAKVEQFADPNKAYAEMEKAVKSGTFGANPTNLKRRMLGDRAGVTFDLTRGDTPYSNWAIFYNEGWVLVMSVRRNAGVSQQDETKFYDSLRFDVTRDPRPKKENPGGGPGTPGVPGRPGGPEGAPPGAPPPVGPPGGM
jgi:hypothetical protein